MPTPAEHILAILVNKGVCSSGLAGSPSSWSGFIGRLLESPDRIVLLNDTPGQAPNPRWLLDFPVVTAIIRGPKEDYESAYSKARGVKDALLGIDPVTTSSGDRIDGINILSDVSLLKYDESSRAVLSINFRLILEPATNALTSRDPL